MTFLMLAYEPDRFPLNYVLALPAVRFSAIDLDRNNEIYDNLAKKFPQIDQELAGTKVLWRWISMPSQIHNARKEIRVPADLHGIKLICSGDIAIYFKAAGASPIDLPSGDWYMSLERGMADGVYSSYDVMDSRGASGLMPFHTHINIGSAPMAIVMNEKVWNSLESDVQKIIMENGRIHRAGDSQMKLDSERKIIEKCEAMSGHTFIELTSAEDKAWVDVASVPSEAWLKKHENGPNGKLLRKVYDEARQQIELMKKQ
jgi:TRAP-type C4-dicarboxylate transport system substrate-binding protein